MDKNKRVQLIVIVGLVLTIISLFLTLYKASFLGENVSDLSTMHIRAKDEREQFFSF